MIVLFFLPVSTSSSFPEPFPFVFSCVLLSGVLPCYSSLLIFFPLHTHMGVCAFDVVMPYINPHLHETSTRVQFIYTIHTFPEHKPAFSDFSLLLFLSLLLSFFLPFFTSFDPYHRHLSPDRLLLFFLFSLHFLILSFLPLFFPNCNSSACATSHLKLPYHTLVLQSTYHSLLHTLLLILSVASTLLF